METAGLPWDNARNALEKLGLLKEGQLLNAAQLFFADAPIELRCAVFATHTSATIIDRHDFHGDILELIDEAQKYILKNIHIGMRLQGMRRVDVPEISPEALREAIINAFCHRDWRDPDYIHVAIFKDRVEIRNPGGLYDDLTLEDLRRGNVSRRRNPLIADLLRRIHLVEAWGRGMPLIHENAPDVAFREVAGLFIASFERPSAAEDDAQTATTSTRAPRASAKTPSSPREAEPLPYFYGGKAPEAHQENTKKTPRKHQENFSQPPTGVRDSLIDHLQQQPSLSARALSEALGLSEASTRHHLRRLQGEGRIRRVGPDKGGALGSDLRHGRLTMSASTQHLTIHLSTEEMQLLQHAADASNKAPGDFLRDAGLCAAEQLLADRCRFVLDEAQWQAFQEALERPAQAKPRLQALLCRAG